MTSIPSLFTDFQKPRSRWPLRLAAVGLSMALASVQAQTFPLTVDSCGETLTFAAPPQAALIHDINMTDMALLLGLQKNMVGVSGITGWYKASPAFKQALGSIPEIAPKYPTMENILAANPDFFFAGWNYGMKVGGDVTPTTLKKYKIPTLVRVTKGDEILAACGQLNTGLKKQS